MAAFAADDDQWVVIVTAAGDRAFCAGHELKHQVEMGDMFTPETGFGGLTEQEPTLNKPVIVVANGSAFGAGSRWCWRPISLWRSLRRSSRCPSG